MNKVLPVEQPFWFTITMPADPRLAPIFRDLAIRIARQVGCAGEPADRFGATLAAAVERATRRDRAAGEQSHIEAVFRVNLSAFEVTLLLKGDDAEARAALAASDPGGIWPADLLEGVTDRFEVSRDPDGVRCRVTRALPRSRS